MAQDTCRKGDGQPVLARGLCRMHYQRERKTGEAYDLAPRICPSCGKEFQPNRTNQVACKPIPCGKRLETRKLRGIMAPELKRLCRYCGAEFESPDGRQHYCSDDCTKTAKSLREAFRRYGMGMDEYRLAALRQQGVCAICKQSERTERNRLLTIDHDHVTGQVRGLLCSQCNRAIGLLGDDPATIHAAALYVEKNRQLRLVN
jgi:hypothetical protein